VPARPAHRRAGLPQPAFGTAQDDKKDKHQGERKNSFYPKVPRFPAEQRGPPKPMNKKFSIIFRSGYQLFSGGSVT
jgi:hypothetical protein